MKISDSVFIMRIGSKYYGHKGVIKNIFKPETSNELRYHVQPESRGKKVLNLGIKDLKEIVMANPALDKRQKLYSFLNDSVEQGYPAKNLSNHRIFMDTIGNFPEVHNYTQFELEQFIEEWKAV